MTNVREIDCSTATGALRSVLLHQPFAHPVWYTYQISLVHLRHVDGMPDPVLDHLDSTHEIHILALDPAFRPDPAVPSTLHPLMPPNLTHQLRGKTDEGARDLFQAFVKALSTGALSPDTDSRKDMLAWLDRWGKARKAEGGGRPHGAV